LKLDEKAFLEIFNGVPQFKISKDELAQGIGVLDLLAEKSQVFASKGEARRAITKENSLSINQEKVSDPETKIDTTYLLDEKYILVRKGKKNWFVLTIA